MSQNFAHGDFVRGFRQTIAAVGTAARLDEALARLPIPKVMQYQLETDCELPGWSSVNFTVVPPPCGS
mgnify:CR=1 FL=1